MESITTTILYLVAAALPVFPGAPTVQAGERAIVRHVTEHYELRVQGTEAEAESLGKILELAWPKFAEVFRAAPPLEPGKRLVIRLFDTAEACLVGAMDDRADMPPIKHPSWFSPGNGTVYLYRHRNDWYTRYLLIYGACLQFHGLAKPKNIDLDAWYTHGLAESLAVHAFDGERLELGTSPAISWMDHPARALAELGGKHLGLDPFTDQRLEVPSVRWSVVRFVLTGAEGRYRQRFEKLALGFSGSKVSGHDFMRTLGAEKRIGEEFSLWLLANQMPLEVVLPDWEVLPDGRILAKPETDGLALCKAKEEFDTIEVVVGAASDKIGGVPAIVMSLQDENDYVQARIVPPLVFVEHIRSGKQYGIETLSLEKPSPNMRVRVRTKDHRAELEIDAKTYPPIEVPRGRVGLAAIGGPVVFDGVRWR